MNSSVDVYWLEQSEAQVLEGADWLSPSEANFFGNLRFAKRRSDWRLGRWTAKNAVGTFLGLSPKPQLLRKIEIRASLSGAPEVFFEGMPAPVSISLSHRSGLGACAVASENSSLGCDLEFIEPHGEAFTADYLSREEQALITTVPPEDQDCLVALLWSAKESALKVLREGLRLDTRSVIVTLESFSFSAANPWNVLQVRCRDGQIFHGWWSQSASFVRTLLAIPPPGPPILLTQQRALTMKNAMGQTAG